MEKLKALASLTQADIRRKLAMTGETCPAQAVEQLDQEVMQVKKARLAPSARASHLKKVTVGLVVFVLPLTSIPRPVRADSGAALFFAAVAIAVAGGLAADAVFDAATSDTTTTTTTTDEDGNTTSTTTTDSTKRSTAAPTSPETPKFLRVT